MQTIKYIRTGSFARLLSEKMSGEKRWPDMRVRKVFLPAQSTTNNPRRRAAYDAHTVCSRRVAHDSDTEEPMKDNREWIEENREERKKHEKR
jgi:hypothetical protein